MILAGDIGGTTSRLALFSRGNPREVLGLTNRPSAEHTGCGEVLAAYLAGRSEPIEAACLGVPGPVVRDRVRATNLPWTIDAADVSARLGGAPVFLLNDLEVFSWGLALLGPERLAVIQEGAPDARGNAAVIAAGTGLGEAGLFWDGTQHVPFAAEGGHTDFGPRTDREMRLLGYLRGRYKHVSYERIISGPGLVNVFEFLRDVEGLPVPAELAASLAATEDAAAVVSAAGLRPGVPIASQALDLFVGLYGAEAGNLALKLKATGGVYVGGGIAPKILPRLLDGAFAAAFRAKGRFAELLASMPVRVVLDPATALYGAARYAEVRLDAASD